MALNRLGDENLIHKRMPPPITMPALNLPPVDDGAIEAEAREAQARIRTIRLGRDSWEQIAKAQSFEGWKRIGAALAIGWDFALRTTGANRPAGQIYSKAFSVWLAQHGFAGIEKTVRSAALDLAEHLTEIEAFRATLSEKRRRQLKHPLSNVAAWRKATAQAKGTDLHRAAALAWRRFVSCAKALPADEAALLWQAALSEAQSMTMPTPLQQGRE
jgi:hypothetical protein